MPLLLCSSKYIIIYYYYAKPKKNIKSGLQEKLTQAFNPLLSCENNFHFIKTPKQSIIAL